MNRAAFSLAGGIDSPVARAGRLAAVIGLHAGALLLLQGGLSQPAPQAPQTAPKTVFVTFVAPQPAPQPQIQPVPPQPKPVEPPKPKREPKPEPKPKPKPKPSERQITQELPPEPPAEPAPPQPAAPETPPEPPVSAPAAPAAGPQTGAPAAPSSPSAPPGPPTPRTITSGISYLYNPPPEYPSQSRRLGEEGKVVLRVLVDEKGMPQRVEIQQSSGSARLDDSARRTVMKYRFKPHVEDGRAVPVYAIIPINFQLN